MRAFPIASLTLAAAAVAAGLVHTAALAHHGWAWAEQSQSELKGVIADINMSPPHPTLIVRGQDGKRWQVDLGNPNQTARSGFTGATAKIGDPITAIGNRNQDASKAHMKAVRIVLAGKAYDLYPERIASN